MEWLRSIGAAIRYVEDNLRGEISVDDVARSAYSSESNFGRMFYLVTGVTVGEYIRNRRLSLAGRDLEGGARVTDVAMRYGYDTSESFSKAFARFHGFPPSEARSRGGSLRYFHPFKINFTVTGGFGMSDKFTSDFYWRDESGESGATPAERYAQLANWAGRARGRNPGVFDALTEWLLDDKEWRPHSSEDSDLAENESILMNGVLARFREQNARLRAHLAELEPSGVVNGAVYAALDRFDRELSGNTEDARLKKAVADMFADFSVMRGRRQRELIAGGRTGSAGVDSVEVFGYINVLKECDAAVQWTLFMPSLVERQQDGFRVETFECRETGAMRFVGHECVEHDESDMSLELGWMRTLDALTEWRLDELPHDTLFMHHFGLCVDVGEWHGVWGRFLRAGAPVPEGFTCIDLLPLSESAEEAGPPYISQFTYATFSGDVAAMHRREGFDSDPMYDVTRNIMLGRGIIIPYPDKYWTAEVFPDGCDKPSAEYMFSAIIETKA